MEMVKRTGYQETDSDYVAVLSEMLEKYSEDDLTELLCECEMLLQTNDIYLTKLNERGLKRLYNLITGIERKCNRRLRDNFQAIHRISLNVGKVILSRVRDTQKLVCSLNAKYENDSRITQYCINSLLQKAIDHDKYIGELQRDVRLMEWERFDLKAYMSYSDTKKVLQIVSDLYAITGGNCEVKPGLLQQALENLSVWDVQIPPDTFSREIIWDIKCLPLYIKDELNYSTFQTGLSAYGIIICQAYSLVIDQNVQALSVARGEGMDALCLPLLRKTIADQNMDTGFARDICEGLLKDLGKLHEIEKQERRPEPLPQETPDGSKKPQTNTPDNGGHKDEETQTKYSVLRLTPEGFWLFRDEKVIYSPLEPKSDYSFSDEKPIKSYLDSNNPYMVTAPTGYFNGCIPEIKKFFLEKMRYVSLADYYMYLWYQHESGNGQKSQKVAFIEYYAHDLYVSGYEVNASDGSYRKIFSDLKIHWGRKPNHIEQDIKSAFEKKILNSNDILMFRTFYFEKNILNKLNKIGVRMVDDSWEDGLKTGNDKLGEVVCGMIKKASN